MDANNLETTGKLMFVSRDPLCAEVSLADVCEATESSGNHFIRNHYRVPNIKRDEWALSVTGLVLNSLEIHYDDLIAMPSTEVVGLMECAGNSRSIVHPRVPGVQWGHGAIGTACWKGVPVHKVLEKAMLLQSASEVVFIRADNHISLQYGWQRDSKTPRLSRSADSSRLVWYDFSQMDHRYEGYRLP